jgi:uncharacterized repeat protein (TIGR04138 family)
MSGHQHPIFELLKRDPRYKLEAYQFVRDALSYAHDELGMGQGEQAAESENVQAEAHLTGQQLCQASHVPIEQFGLMARVVLTGASPHRRFWRVVYNLIDIGLMKSRKPTAKKTSSTTSRGFRSALQDHGSK